MIEDELQHPGRLDAVERTKLLDSPSDRDFDQLTRLAAHLLRVPNALVTLVARDRQFVKSSLEDGEEAVLPTGSSQTLDRSFCKFAVASREPFIVEDSRTHPLVQHSDAVDAGVLAYAGVPLEVNGEAIGALCVIDSKPRSWSPDELGTLRALARSAMRLIEERMGQHQSSGAIKNTGLLKAVRQHLRSLAAYDALLSSPTVELDMEKTVRRDVERSLADLIQAQESGSEIATELEKATAAYIRAEQERSEATAKFAAGNITLPELNAMIEAQDNALDHLRLAALNCGAGL
jgi:GAF domain-containing protein